MGFLHKRNPRVETIRINKGENKKVTKMNLKVYRLREDAKLPLRAHASDAGMDLFYCPNGDKKLYDCSKNYFIPPKESRLIPTGIKVEVPYGYMLEIKNKSGIASKSGIAQTTQATNYRCLRSRPWLRWRGVCQSS